MFGAQDDQYQPGMGGTPTNDVHADGTLGAPANDNGMTMMPVDTTSTESGMPPYEPTGTVPTSSGRAMSEHTPEELISIKQEALQNLKPLVGHLQQTPEEKFRTAMMMIQAADDQSLIPDAYEAAKNISDDKARAQALLDVVNEINYFTSQHAAQ